MVSADREIVVAHICLCEPRQARNRTERNTIRDELCDECLPAPTNEPLSTHRGRDVTTSRGGAGARGRSGNRLASGSDRSRETTLLCKGVDIVGENRRILPQARCLPGKLLE